MGRTRESTEISRTKAEADHFACVAELGCILSDKWGHECGGRTTCHHPIGIEWRGMGQKAPDDCVIPLCDSHHQHSKNAIHLMGKRPWEAKYGTQRDLLETTRTLSGASGLEVA